MSGVRLVWAGREGDGEAFNDLADAFAHPVQAPERHGLVAERYVVGNLALHCHFGLTGPAEDSPAKQLCARINRAHREGDFNLPWGRSGDMLAQGGIRTLADTDGGMDETVFVDVAQRGENGKGDSLLPVYVGSEVRLQFLDRCRVVVGDAPEHVVHTGCAGHSLSCLSRADPGGFSASV